ncbi:HNH endonuclease [Burkholderiaceae bacterium FT117]|uniref:HNH endonuclease n=1 Tax=Zeimonas sediminis TaxID=2944268 RepID=UPI002342E779|nr:HNH endonuclease signature motif containing protein [Zeimonas sediminis]MCM5570061.1 HNH endonuclease [Zeimonas sediminis]
MAFEPGLVRGQIIDNSTLSALFKCSSQGGMRRSRVTNTLVLVSNHVESIYDDRWLGDIFHYTGMGQEGDQALSFMQNKTLAMSRTNGVDVHLFEVDRPRQYQYQGRVVLAADPYEEIQPDQKGTDRRVWVFPLRLVEGVPTSVSQRDFEEERQHRERKARRLSNAELRLRAQRAPKLAGDRIVTGRQYERNPYVSEFAKRRANGYCELCSEPAPFSNARGEPYLETHHIVWLALGGEDSTENTVALCPNCHRRMHVLDEDADKEKLRARLASS